MVGQHGVVATDPTARVTPLELFFDLVFVYALTQVTALLATDISAIGFARGLVVLALVWWCWVGYSWLGNVAQADEGLLRIAFFAVMMAMFVMAITIRESFTDLPGGLPGPLVFVACYIVARVVHLGLFWVAAAEDAGLRRQLSRFAVTVAGSVACSSRVGCSVPRGSSRCGPARCWPTSAAPPRSERRAGASGRPDTSRSGTD